MSFNESETRVWCFSSLCSLFKKEIFIQLLRLATQGQFLYKDILYKQINGVTMGSPLGPTIANCFLANLENRILKNKNQHSPKLYLRYVDDVFAVFENNNDCLSFLNVLNSQHKNIKFTLEQSSDFICFLDVKIEINCNSLDTYTWRKPTNTGLLLNFNAFCPQKWKSGLILCLLYRAKLICSSKMLFNREINNLRKMFCLNGYPCWFFNKVLNKFVSNITVDRSTDCRTYYLTIPYFSIDSRRFLNRLSKIFKSKFNVKVCPVYKTFKIGNYFQLKSTTPLGLCSNVIYEFTCSCDANLTYIGMSTRHLSTRAKEHLDFNSQVSSAIKNHVMCCNVCSSVKLNLNSFKIIKKCKSEFHTKIHEA